MFNNMFTNCVYPSSWSKGVVVPIYKKGDKCHSVTYNDYFSEREFDNYILYYKFKYHIIIVICVDYYYY